MTARWTKEDDEFLEQGYRDGLSGQVIADRLGRTRTGIHMRAIRLGLRVLDERGDKSPQWIAIQKLCADGVGRSAAEIADAIGANRENIARLMLYRHEKGYAHVERYLTGRPGKALPVWLPSPGDDVPSPASSRNAQKQKRCRARKPVAVVERREAAPVPPPDQHEIIRALFGMGAAA